MCRLLQSMTSWTVGRRPPTADMKSSPRKNHNAHVRQSFAVTMFTLLILTLLLVACGGGSSRTPASSPLCPPSSGFPRTTCDPVPFPNYQPADYDVRKSMHETPEYTVRYGTRLGALTRTDTHLDTIKAAAAYARGATGAGETIVIADTGIRDTHSEFANGGFPGNEKVAKETQQGYAPTDGEKSHGTRVAAVAAANRDGVGMHGVAFDARIAFLETPLETSDGVYRPTVLSRRNDAFFAEFLGKIVEFAQRSNAFIINQSFAVSGAVSSYREEDVRFYLRDTAAVLAQSGTPDADKPIIVWAAGNAGSQYYPDSNGNLDRSRPAPIDSPELWAGLGVHFPELQKNTIAVVAVRQGGTIADFSNRCGLAKSFCLAAPTDLVAASWHNDNDYALIGGTSAAAPVVSGSLAVLRQYFRGQLGNTELVTRLLATADRTGIYADKDIYGHGLVNLDAATSPVGVLMTSVSTDPNRRAFAGSGIDVFGGAFGTAIQHRLANVKFAAFDELDAPFLVTMAGQVRYPTRDAGLLPRTLRVRQAETMVGVGASVHFEVVPGPGRQADELLLSFAPGLTLKREAQDGAGWWLSWGRHDGLSLGLYRVGSADSFLNRSAFAAPWLSLVRDGPGFGVAAPLPFGGRLAFAVMRGTAWDEGYERTNGDSGTGVIMDYQPGGSLLSLQAGFVRETDGFLGARSSGAFGAASAATTFSGFNHRWPLNTHWHALSSGYFGWTRPSFQGSGLLRGASRVYSSAFSLGLERRSWWRAGDWLGVRVSQPLRVESGTVDLRLAAGRTRYGEVLYQRHRVNLEPTGRSLRAEAAWRGPFAAGDLFLSLGLERHANQDARQDLQFLGAIRFERFF